MACRIYQFYVVWVRILAGWLHYRPPPYALYWNSIKWYFQLVIEFGVG
jgi:hypothetical protein